MFRSYILALYLCTVLSGAQKADAIDGNWNKATCQTEPIDLLQLPRNTYFDGGILEVVEDFFGPALYWRESVHSCSHKFAIPLPFSVRSIAHTRNHFYVIRDDVTSDEGNLYRIPDYDLIGGFLHWSTKAVRQNESCSNSSSDDQLCSLQLYMNEYSQRISIGLEENLLFGHIQFIKLFDKFVLVHSFRPDLPDKLWLWKNWHLVRANSKCSSERYTYVASAGGLSNELVVLQPNYKPLLLKASQNATAIQTNEATHDVKLIAIQALDNFYGPDYLGLDVDGESYVFYDSLQISEKLGKLFNRARRIFVANDTELFVLDSSKNLYVNEDIITDLASTNWVCPNSTFLSTIGCVSPYAVALEQDDKQQEREICREKGATAIVEDNVDPSLFDEFRYEINDWLLFEGRQYRFFATPFNRSAASEKCRSFSDRNAHQVAHLAMLKTGTLRDFAVRLTQAKLATDASQAVNVWLGAGNNSNGFWSWLDGEGIPLPPQPTTPPSGGYSGSGSGDFETTTAVTQGVSGALHWWGSTWDGGDFVPEPSGAGECLALGNRMSGDDSYGWKALECERTEFFLCEKYKVDWEYFPDTQSIATDQPDAMVLGSIPASSSNPADECASLCEQRAYEGCFTFTITYDAFGAGKCYGGSNFESVWLAVENQVAGKLMVRDINTLIPTQKVPVVRERNFTIQLGETNVLSGWKCREGITFTMESCRAEGCHYDLQSSTCYMKFIPMQFNLTDRGCWKDDVSNPLMTSLEGFLPYLEGAYSTRKNALLKCSVATKLKGLSLFALQDGGRCVASNPSDPHFASLGASFACKSDGRGAVAANHVYEIQANQEDLRRVTGPFTLQRTLTTGVNAQAVVSARDIVPMYLVYSAPALSPPYVVSMRLVSEDLVLRSNYVLNMLRFQPYLPTPNQNTFLLKREPGGYVYESMVHANHYLHARTVNTLVIVPGYNEGGHLFMHRTEVQDCDQRRQYRIRTMVDGIAGENCLSNDQYCYQPTSDNYPDCFNKIRRGGAFSDEGWGSAPNRTYEYALIGLDAVYSQTPAYSSGTLNHARAVCKNEAGHVAYVGLDNATDYNFITDVVLGVNATSTLDNFAWIGVNHNVTQGQFTTWLGYPTAFVPPTNLFTAATGECAYLRVGWQNVQPNVVECGVALPYTLCQRLTADCNIDRSLRQSCGDNSFTSLTKQECFDLGCCYEEILDGTATCFTRMSKMIVRDEKPDERLVLCATNYSICEQNGNECHVNATCIDQGHLYQCVCHEGFTGDGKVCVKMFSCPDGWDEFNLACYIVKYDVTLYDAQEECQKHGAEIVSIHSNEERVFVTGLMSSTLITSLYIGLRFDPLSKELYWTDGSDYDFIFSGYTGDAILRCTKITAHGTFAGSCLALSAYGCKLNITQPPLIKVEMSAYPVDIYPGFAELRLNGEDIPWGPPTSDALEEGCLYLAGLTWQGSISNTVYSCGDEMPVDDVLRFAEDVQKEKYSYVLLARGGKELEYKWQILAAQLAPSGIELYHVDDHFDPQEQIVTSSSYEGSNVVDFTNCQSSDGCKGVELKRGVGGSVLGVARVPENTTSYQFGVNHLTPESNSSAYEIKYMSKMVEDVTSQETSCCPWMTKIMRPFGTANIVSQDSNCIVGNCTDPPCHIQASCLFPKTQKNDSVQSDFVGSALMICEQQGRSGYICPVNLIGPMYGDPLHASFNLYIPRRKAPPVLATFDDLVHLGSPPHELGLEKNASKVEWRPLLWRWKERRYARLVTGVVGRALRFNGQQVQTSGDECWGKLGISPACKSGFTVSFWIRLMSWPTSNALLVIRTVRSTVPGTSCGGFAVHLTSNEKIVVKVSVDQEKQVKSAKLTYRKWTKVWFSWSPDSELSLYLDSIEVTAPVQNSLATTGSVPACDQSTLTVGSTSDEGYEDGQFDIDELVIQNKNLSEKDSELFTGVVPLRHQWVNEVPTILQATPLIEGTQQCRTSTTFKRCGRLVQKCPGHSIFCHQGFTLSVKVKVIGQLTDIFINNHILVVGNIPFFPSAESMGFRLEIRQMDRQEGGVNVLLFYLRMRMRENHYLTLPFMPDIRETVWIQYHENGTLALCMRWPTNCRSTQVPAMNSFSESDYLNVGSHMEMVVGPVNVKIANGAEPSRTNEDSVEVSDLWFIEQSPDLIMAADEISQVGSPIHFQVTEEGTLRSTDGLIKFEVRGNHGSIQATYGDDLFNRYLVFTDTLTAFSALDGDQGHSWLQLDDLGRLRCLKNPDLCPNGFTVQFWFRLKECKMGQRCTIISCASSSASTGFDFYVDPPSYHIATVATASRQWRLTGYFLYYGDEDDFTLIRISWNQDTGLSLFANGRAMYRTTLTTKRVWPGLNEIDPHQSLTIGRRNDYSAGFGSFDFGEMHYWESLVEGSPFLTLGSCMEGWTQIGESCYKYDTPSGNTSYPVAEQACSRQGAELPQIRSWAEFLAVASFTDPDNQNFWLDLVYSNAHDDFVWSSTQQFLSEQVFSALYYAPARSTNTRFGLFRGYDSNGDFTYGLLLSYDVSNSMVISGRLCRMPLAKDPFMLGCAEPTNALFTDHTVGEYSLPDHTEAAIEAYGSYNLPRICTKLCQRKFKSKAAALDGSQCICFDKVTSFPTVKNHILCTSEPGFSALEAYQWRYNSTRMFKTEFQCGVDEFGGRYSCGNGRGVASVYAFSFPLPSDSFAPLSTFTLVASQIQNVAAYASVKFSLRDLQCCAVFISDALGASACNCGREQIWFQISFGDGSAYHDMKTANEIAALELTHFYELPGEYEVLAEVRSAIGAPPFLASLPVEVVVSDVPLSLSYIHHEIGIPGALMEVSTWALSGTKFSCTWSYGDGSPAETLKLEDVPIPTTFHRYKADGFYSVSVECSNRVSLKSAAFSTVVQTPIRQLYAPEEAVAIYGTDYIHEWSVQAGSSVQCTMQFGNLSLPDSSSSTNAAYQPNILRFDAATNTGYARITGQVYAPNYQGHDSCLASGLPTTYLAVVTCHNFVTQPVPVVLTYVTFEAEIRGVRVELAGNGSSNVPLFGEVCVRMEITHGSNVHVAWNFGDAEHPEKDFVETCGADECYTRFACTQYSEAGPYQIYVEASNALGTLRSSIIGVFIENKLESIEIGISPSPVPREISEVLLTHKPPYPRGILEVDFGDGGSLETHQIDFGIGGGEMTLTHRYDAIGFHNISLWLRNNVSSINTTTTIQIGYHLVGAQFYTSTSSFLKSIVDLMVLHVVVPRGSEPRYKVDFGDGTAPAERSENVNRSNPTLSDWQALSHSYQHPGTYQPTVLISNVFGTARLALNVNITVQNSLTDSECTLVADPVPIVAFPPGTALLGAHLERSDNTSGVNVTEGWANDVSVVWRNLVTKQMLDYTKAAYEIDLFPKLITFGDHDIGEVKIEAKLSNLVSTHSLHYSFTVMRTVSDVIVEVTSAAGYANSTFPNSSVESISGASVTISVATGGGSKVNYSVDFGDEHYDVITCPLFSSAGYVAEFTHSYRFAGVFSIMVNVSNPISYEEAFLPNCVRVFDAISGVKLSSQYIDLDTSEVDLFAEGAELYNVYFGKLGIAKNNVTYLPLRRVVVFRVCAATGTNVTTLWRFENEGVTVKVERSNEGHVLPTAFDDHSNVQCNISQKAIIGDKMEIKFLPKIDEIQLQYLGSDYVRENCAAESSLLVKFSRSGIKSLNVLLSNGVTSSRETLNVKMLAEVRGITFIDVEPPTANRTANISILVHQIGSDSCFQIQPGDHRSHIAFGMTSQCAYDPRISSDLDFHLLTDDPSLYTGDQFSRFTFTGGDLSNGSATLNFTYYYTYIESGLRKIEVIGFNAISQESASIDLAVTEVLCDYPFVLIEKNSSNSRLNARRIASFLEFRLYSVIRPNCKSTSRFLTRWDAYDVVGSNSSESTAPLPHAASRFQDPDIRFLERRGLLFTPNSESVAIEARFFPIGLHLVCLNVAMEGVEGVNASDCIFIEMILPPLVAAVEYGVRRTVGFGEVIRVDAESASYDPDVINGGSERSVNGSSGLKYLWSCPFLIEAGELGTEIEALDLDDEAELMFGGEPDWTSSIFCNLIELECHNSYHELQFDSVSNLNDLSMLANSAFGLSRLQDHCGDTRHCVVSVDFLFNSEASGMESVVEDDKLCANVTYRCNVPASSTLFDYYESNHRCLASGYYPKAQQAASQRCNSLAQSFPDSCGFLQMDTNLLQLGSSYMIRFRLSDSKTSRVARSFQLIDVTLGEPPKLSINCRFNCNIKTNSRTALVLNVVHNSTAIGGTNNSSIISYTWTLSISTGTAGRKRRETDEKEFLPVSEFAEMTSTGIHGVYMVIRPHTLTPGRKYRVRVTGETPNTSPGYSESEFVINLPPYGGSCQAEPTEGISLEDLFTISCPDWMDEGLNVDRSVPITANEFALLYQVYVYTSSNSTPNLLSFGNSPVIEDKHLPPGLPENDYQVLLQVRILDEYGESVVLNITAKVFAPTELSVESLSNISSGEVPISNSQGISQLSMTVASLLNNPTSNQTNSTSKNLPSLEEDHKKKERAWIRTSLVDAVISRINPENGLDGKFVTQLCEDLLSVLELRQTFLSSYSVQQSARAISGLTEIIDEVDDETQAKAADALSGEIDSLKRLSVSKPSEDVAETASVMVVGIDNVMKASRRQLLDNAEVAGSNTSLVPVTSFSPPVPSGASPKAILDEEESFLSPEEREERRASELRRKEKTYMRNRDQARNVGKTAIHSVAGMSDALLQNKVIGEPSLDLRTKGLQLRTQKTNLNQLAGETNATKGVSDLFSNSLIQLCSCDTSSGSLNGDDVDAELLTMDVNPYVWDESANNVRTPVVSLTFKHHNTGTKAFQNSSNVYRLELPVDPVLSSAPPQLFNFTPTGDHQMSYHEFTTATNDDVTFITILPQNTSDDDIRMRVYFLLTDKLDTFPSIGNNTFVREIPDHSDPVNQFRLRINGSDISPNSRYVFGIHQIVPLFNDFAAEGYYFINISPSSRYVFGIHQIDEIGNVTKKENGTLPAYLLSTVITSCRFWNETTEKWETAGCVVSSESTSSTVVCLCTHLTSFGAGFLVAPNPIDFASLGDKLQNLKDNLAVLLTLVFLLLLYVVGIIACRRQDKKDVKKWSIALLMDNKLNGEYFYQVTVKTGWTRDADTKSRVRFVLSGDKADTKVRILADSQKTEFSRGSVRKFLMVEDRPLGMLSCIKIWHDNSGSRSLASWFLDHIIVTDLQTNKKFYFMCDDWLAVDESDGSVERLLPVAGDEQIGSFKNLFTSSTKRDFSDGHLWFSLFSRPTKSNFTRVQRLSCAFVLLLCTMLTSAMFYGREADDSGQQGRIEIGPISLTVQQLLISIQASLIVIPVNILLVQLFRKIPPKSTEVNISSNIRNILNTSALDTLTENETGNKDKSPGITKTRNLPYWFIYVAWCLLFIVGAVCASFVFIYSVDWGAQKSNDWLLSIVLSLTQSIFVVQPIKVVFGAVVLSCAINRFAKDRAEEVVEERDQMQVNVQDLKRKEEEWLVQCPLEDEFDDVERSFRPDPEKLAEAKKAREHHKRMISTMHDVATYLLYVIFLLIAANVAKDNNAFRMHQSLSKLFLERDPAFLEVRTVDDFWSWCDEVLVEGLHASNWYNGKRVTWMESRFLSNRQTFVIGPARIRQLRAHEGACFVNNSRTGLRRDCIEGYTLVGQEDSDFTEGWVNDDVATNVTQSPWSFQNFMALGGFPYHGLIRWYDGGGYSATLGNTAKSSRKILDKLKRNSWIDRQTAAIFVEFTVYNANINLFSTCVLLLERSGNGAFFGYPSITSIRLYEFIDGKGTLLVGIYVVFALVLCYKMFSIFMSLRANGLKFFHCFWNWVDFVSAAISLFAIAMYAVRTIHQNMVLEKIHENFDKETFVNFQYIALWNDSFRYSMAFTLFLATIKFNQLLAFNQRIRLLAYTLGHAAKPIAYFLASFSIYFAAFLFLANVWFHQKLYPYSTLYLTAEEMLSMLLGRFDFTELKQADPFLGPFFFTGFAGLCTILLINMFIVILDDSIKAARIEVQGAKNEFEVVDYFKKELITFCYSFMPKWLGNAIASRPAFQQDEQAADTPMELLEKRIDQLMSYVSKLELEYCAQVSIDELQAELEETELEESRCKSNTL